MTTSSEYKVANETLRLRLRMLHIDDLPLLDDDLITAELESNTVRCVVNLPRPWSELDTLRRALNRTLTPRGSIHVYSVLMQTAPLSSTTVFLAGAISGIVSRTSTAPFDRIKILLQADGTTKKGNPRVAPGSGLIRRTCQYVYKDGGIRGFWRGNLANILKVTPESATKFYLYDYTMRTLYGNKEQLAATDRLTAGCIAGAVSQLVVYPLDVTKTRLAASKSGQFKGIWHCIQMTIRHEGYSAMYKGVRPALAAIIPASGVDLAVYNTLRERYGEREDAAFQRLLESRTMDILQEPDRVDIDLPPPPRSAPPIAWTLAFGAVSWRVPR
jgi:hypothetical protein